MTSDHENKLTPDEERIIDKCLSEVFDTEELDFSRPSDETILAFVTGTATAAQKEQIEDAILASREFADELIATMKHVEYLGTEDAARAFDAVRAPEVSRRLADKIRSVIANTRFPGERVVAPLRHESLWARLCRSWVPRVAVPAVVIAAVVLGIIIPRHKFITGELQYAGEVSRSGLQPFITRGGEQSYDSPRIAALEEFRTLVEFDESTQVFRSKPTMKREDFPSAARVVVVRLVPPSGLKKIDIKVLVPQLSTATDSLVTLWVLTLPSRRLYSARVSSDWIEFPWREDLQREGCLTITCPVDDKYVAANGSAFRIE